MKMGYGIHTSAKIHGSDRVKQISFMDSDGSTAQLDCYAFGGR